MHILITDSGVGGLSVCAYAERFLRNHSIGQSVKLTYVNASPENDFGYNSMASRGEKLDYFDRFLRIISDRYDPDSIYIACNTLSVLFPDTEFSRIVGIPVKGIVEAGVHHLVRELDRFPRSTVAIFGTPTTIEENTYPYLLGRNGVDESRIVSQSCPSLADTISEDFPGLNAREKINKFVDLAIEKTKAKETEILAYLACTHYGYRRDYFSGSFRKRGLKSRILNPNECVIEDLFSKYTLDLSNSEYKPDVNVEFISRYQIPETALETIGFFLDGVSPETVRAFKNFTHDPRLF